MEELETQLWCGAEDVFSTVLLMSKETLQVAFYTSKMFVNSLLHIL